MYNVQESLQHWVLGVTLGFFVLCSPTLAAAQSPDDVRRQLLEQLIVLLQEQLTLLQSQNAPSNEARPVVTRDDEDINLPVADAVFFDDDSFLEALNATIIARYRIDDMDIDSPSRTHERYVDRMADLMPEAYHQYLVEFVVFETPSSNVDAFVETALPYDAAWRYGVNEDIFDEWLYSDIMSELIVHEFAHLFSLHEAFDASRPRNCHEYFAERGGCINPDTLYGLFLDTFWDEARLDLALEVREARNVDRARAKFYRENADEFVSQYAASSPAEDFAESFTSFVLYEDDEYGDVAAEKVSFFNRFSYPRALKEEILEDL